MRIINLNSISFLQIQIFIAAGNELNYTRAAEICHVSQPTVSRSMDALEKATGIQLFIRKQGNMRLTPAGKELWIAFRKFRASLEQEILRAHDLQAGYKKTLAVSFPQSLDPERFLTPMTDAFRQRYFPLRIKHYLEEDFEDTLEKLLSYKLDVSITHLHNSKKVEQYRTLSYKAICYTPLSAFMHESNPLCRAETLSISDLRAQKLILPSANENTEYVDMIRRLFQENAINPMIADYCRTPAEALLNIQTDDQVLISDSLFHTRKQKWIQSRPLENTQSGLIIIWRNNDLADSLPIEFVRQYKETAIMTGEPDSDLMGFSPF